MWMTSQVVVRGWLGSDSLDASRSRRSVRCAGVVSRWLRQFSKGVCPCPPRYVAAACLVFAGSLWVGGEEVSAAPVFEPCAYVQQLGLDSETVHAIGLDADWVDEIIVRAELEPVLLEQIDAAMLDVFRARARHASAESALRTQGATDSLQIEITDAATALALAETAYHDALDALRAPIGDLAEAYGGEGAVVRFENVFNNRHRDVPAAMRVIELSEEQWESAESCYALIVGGGIEVLSDTQRAFWAELTGRLEFIEAQARIDSAGSGVDDAFRACGG